MRETESRLGPVDILVNNSATNVGQGPALDVTDEMLDKMVEINIKAALRLVRLTVPRMIERGTGGSIINVSSISGLKPQAGGLLYSFTKAGLIMMTRSWAREFGRHGIRVNALAPGLIQTDFSAYFWQDEGRRQEFLNEQPIRAAGTARRRRRSGALPRLGRRLVCHRTGLRGRRRDDRLNARLLPELVSSPHNSHRTPSVRDYCHREVPFLQRAQAASQSAA